MGQRLFAENVFPGVECGDHRLFVHRWRRGDHHQIHLGIGYKFGRACMTALYAKSLTEMLKTLGRKVDGGDDAEAVRKRRSRYCVLLGDDPSTD
jgi:hypothetical protein